MNKYSKCPKYSNLIVFHAAPSYTFGLDLIDSNLRLILTCLYYEPWTRAKPNASRFWLCTHCPKCSRHIPTINLTLRIPYSFTTVKNGLIWVIVEQWPAAKIDTRSCAISTRSSNPPFRWATICASMIYDGIVIQNFVSWWHRGRQRESVAVSLDPQTPSIYHDNGLNKWLIDRWCLAFTPPPVDTRHWCNAGLMLCWRHGANIKSTLGQRLVSDG